MSITSQGSGPLMNDALKLYPITFSQTNEYKTFWIIFDISRHIPESFEISLLIFAIYPNFCCFEYKKLFLIYITMKN